MSGKGDERGIVTMAPDQLNSSAVERNGYDRRSREAGWRRVTEDLPSRLRVVSADSQRTYRSTGQDQEIVTLKERIEALAKVLMTATQLLQFIR